MNSTLLFFVKFPQNGAVKTRLAKDIGADQAAALYRCFVLDMLETLARIPQRICVCYAPEQPEQRYKEWLGSDYAYMAQQGADLGERMKNSFCHAFEQGIEKVVLLGSDLPDLPSHCVQEAFERLDTHDSVIGPSHDGGYYLIGFRQDAFLPEAFQGIQWSQSSVYQQTIHTLKTHAQTFFILPAWNDIDNLTELRQWYQQYQSEPEHCRAMRTLQYIREKCLSV